MYSGTSERWWTAVVGILVLTAAAPVVLSTASLSGPSSARAAEESPSTPVLTPVPASAPTPTPTPTKATGDEAEAVPDEEAPSGEDSAGEKKGEKKSDEKPAAKEGAADEAAGPKKTDEKFEVGGGDDASKLQEAIVPESVDARGPDNDIPSRKESFLTWLYRSLGTRYVVIFLIITFNAVALIVMILLGLRRNIICPERLATAFTAKLNEKKYQEAYELAKQDRSVMGKVLAAGMARLPDGYELVQEAMQEVGEEQNLRLEQRNGYIALIAQIGPMFGLLGTVDGMVQAFDTIAHSNVTPKPSELAQGIGMALVTTVVGLWIAIPMLAFYHIIRNRLSRLMGETAATSGNLMKRFAAVQVSPKKS